jgi:sugar lactone lactonase YvrE
MSPDTTILLEGLAFPESPRWQDNKLWFSNVWAQQVMAVNMAGVSETVVTVEGYPSGLGWLPTGQLVVVSFVDRCLLRLDADGLVRAADLSYVKPSNCNDMVVSQQGWAYIGTTGFDCVL